MREFIDPATWAVDMHALDAWVRSVYHFRPEAEELLKDPILSMDEIHERGWFDGDCDDISMFYAALLRPAYPLVRFVAIRYQPDPEFSHVFVEFARAGRSYTKVDPTVDPGTEYREIERMEEYV